MVIGESNSDMIITEGEENVLDVSSCILSVEVDDNLVRYALFDESSSTAVLFNKCAGIRELKGDSYISSSNEYHKVIITQSCGSYSLFPSGIQELSAVTSGKNTDLITAIDATLTFEEHNLTSAIKTIFPGASLRHGVSGFIVGVLERTKFLNGVRIYADVKDQLVHILIVANGKLLSAVTEQIESSQDVIYHLLARIEAYNLNQLEDVICLSGNVSSSGIVYMSLKNYIRDIQINKGLNYQKLERGSAEVNKQEFFTVINSYQCE